MHLHASAQSPRLSRARWAQAGFTLTELIVVMVIIAVLAVVLVPKMTSMSAISQRAEYDKVISAVEYARRSAVATRRYVCVAVAATTVTLTVDPNPPESTATPFGGTCPFSQALALPTKDASCGSTNQACVKSFSISPSTGSFQFDALGRASTTVTLTITGYNAITVEGETGYVH